MAATKSAAFGGLLALMVILQLVSSIAATILPDASLDGSGEDCAVSSCPASSIMQRSEVRGVSSESLTENQEPEKGDPPRAEDDSLVGTLERLIEFEEQTNSNDSQLVSEAQHLHDDLVAGGADAVVSDTAGEANVVDLINAESTQVSAEEAAKEGIEITQDDLTTLHHGVNMEAKNKNAVEGDMVPANASQEALFMQLAAKHGSYAWAGTPWPNGAVTYCWASDLPAGAVKAFNLAVDQFKKAIPCITWQQIAHGSGKQCAQSGAIYVQAVVGDGCWSYVGKINKHSQELQIASPGCDSVGTTMHEIGHALGMAHEQSRPDRDTYVSVDFDNTVEDAQFTISPNADTVRPYDILSLMHYGAGDFATDGSRPVITVKSKGYEKYTTDPNEYGKYKIGDRIGLSQTDVNQLADMYNNVVAGGCVASVLTSSTTCVDKLVNGAAWRDGYGDCDKYRGTSTASDPCTKYTSKQYCCGCGGGWAVQSYTSGGSSPRRRTAAVSPRRRSAVVSPRRRRAASSCADSTSYNDPKWGDSCAAWVGYNCNDHDFSADLKQNCPVACQACSAAAASSPTPSPTPPACADSTSYKDPQWKDPCSGWLGYKCDGHAFSADLKQYCPVACKVCSP